MYSSRDEQPIVALCTPRGSGAIAVLRISGVGSVEIVDKIASLSSNKTLRESLTHTIHHGHVRSISDGSIVDEVLFFLMRAPKTFTGEDTVEISCHNNQFLISRIISEVIACGARHALPGEFSKRAFLNNKLDLLQAEAIHEVISAQTENALRRSMSHLKGTFSNYIQRLEEDILKLITYVEASFEFLDEEQRDIDLSINFKKELNALIDKMASIKDSFGKQKQIKEGVKIALVGSVNVGKSTLINTLSNQDRAIVADQPGTTRDSIEANLYRNGNFWTIIDTAGLRKTNDEIEKKGVERTLLEAEKSDIVLLIYDASKDIVFEEETFYDELKSKCADKILIVANKEDLLRDKLSLLDVIYISAKNKTGIDNLLNKIEIKIQEIFSQMKSPFLINTRQFELLSETERILKTIQTGLVKQKFNDNLEYELISHHLRDSLEALSELTGNNVSELVMNSVFKSFCVGK